jgi:Polymerase beta, Nucleotidyltransferase
VSSQWGAARHYVGPVSVFAAVQRLQEATEDGGLAKLCEGHGIRVLTLFGSARTDPATARDLDLAVLLRSAAQASMVELVPDLMDLSGTEDVDVLLLNGASPTARFAGLVNAVPLYESEPGAWAQCQMAAAVEFYETEWLRRLDLELLAG